MTRDHHQLTDNGCHRVKLVPRQVELSVHLGKGKYKCPLRLKCNIVSKEWSTQGYVYCLLWRLIRQHFDPSLCHLPHFASSLLCPAPLCVPLHQLFHCGGAYTRAGKGEQTERLSTEARRREDEVERRRRQALQQWQHPPGRCNETEGKKNRRRNVVSLTTQWKQNSPCPLLGPQLEVEGSEEEMHCATICSITQMFGNRRGHSGKKPLTSTFRGWWYGSEENKGSQFIHYTGSMTILWCSCCPCRWSQGEWGEGWSLAD